jgi:hypothetical protein
MTEPRDPQTPAPDAPPPEHHGLAEELREELAEVVEHVPQPVRWTVGKIAWLVSAGVLLVLVIAVVTGALYLARRTEWVAQELSLFGNQALATRSDVRVEMRDLRGNPFTGLTLIEPRVRFRDGDLPPLLEAKRIHVAYSAWALLTGRRRAIDVRLEQPVVWMSRGRDGRLRLPQWKGGPAGKGQRPVDVTVTFRDGRVMMPHGMEGFEGLDLDLAVRTGQPLTARLDRLAWKRGPFHTTLDRLRGELVAGRDSVRVTVRELRGPELALRGRAAWHAKGGDRIVHLEVARVRWGLLARVFRNGAFDVPGEGAVTLDARGERAWTGTFRSQLDWDGLVAGGEGEATWKDAALRIEPLRLRSNAATLDGWVTYQKEGWAVGGDVDRGDPSQWKPIHITGWPAGLLHGRFRYAVDTRRKGRPEGRLDARLGGSELAGWKVDSATVAVDFPFHQPVRFVVDAQRRGGRFGLAAATDPRGWGGDWQLHGFPLEEWPDGRASGLRGWAGGGQGTVRADSSGMRVTGDLDGTASSWLGMQTARWRLGQVEGRLLPTPDLRATAHLDDVMYLGVHFDSAAVGFTLGDRVVALERIEAVAADSLVTADGNARWDAAHWALQLPHARFRSDQFDWSADEPVWLSGDAHGVDFDHLTGRDGDARIAIRGRWAAPGGVYDWTLTGDDLALGRLGLPLDLGLSGSADVRLDVRGMSGDPRWTFTADARQPGVRGHAADSVHVTLAGAPSRAELRDGVFVLDDGRIAGTLRIEGTHAAWPDTLTPAGVIDWLATAARWEGEFHADRVPLGRLAHLASAASGFSGAASGVLEVAGSPAHPRLGVRGSIAEPRWRDFAAEGVEANARYADGRLTVDEVRMTHRTLSSRITGSMPLALALGRPLAVPEDTMAWSVDVPSGDLAIVPLFVPQVASARGGFEARATVAGTPRHPRLDGYARVREGAARLEGREEVLEHLRADLRFDQSGITLDSLSARQGARGRVSGAGHVALRGFGLDHYRFDLGLREFSAVEQGLYAASFSGDFVVTDGPRVHGTLLPMVEGRVDLDRAAILFDFANQNEMERLAATTQPLFWVYRIEVEAKDHLHWQPPNGDLEFSAHLTLEQTPDSLLIFGEMSGLRGTYWFLSNKFDVSQADLTFDNVMGVDPLLTVVATTRIVAGPETSLGVTTSSGSSAHVITATLSGRSSKPGITLSDDQNAWDQPRILRELTLGTVVGPTAQLSDPVDNYVTRTLNRTLSAEMSRLFQGYVDEWALERERGGLFTGTGDLVATVGVPLGRNLSVRYRGRLGVANGDSRSPVGSTDDLFERNVEAEYRLNRFFYVTTEFVERRPTTATTQATTGTRDFNVNLKARWEY